MNAKQQAVENRSFGKVSECGLLWLSSDLCASLYDPELSLNTAWHDGHCLCVIPNKIHVSQRQNCLLSFGWTQDFETKFGAQGEEMFVSIEMIETFL